MTNKRLLTSRHWYVDGNWYTPLQFINDSYKSVVYCDHIGMSSSAGDWSDLLFQQFGKILYIILFPQRNAYPSQ